MQQGNVSETKFLFLFSGKRSTVKHLIITLGLFLEGKLPLNLKAISFRQTSVQEPLESELNSRCLEKKGYDQMLRVLKAQKKSLVNPQLQISLEKRDCSSMLADVVAGYLYMICFCCSVPEISFSLLSSSRFKYQLSSLQLSLTTSHKINSFCIAIIVHAYFYSLSLSHRITVICLPACLLSQT